MNNTVVPPRLHPALLIAAIAVTLFAIVGIGVLTGLIPTRPSEPATTQAPTPQAVAPQAATQSVPQPAVQSETPAPRHATAKAARPPAERPAPVRDTSRSQPLPPPSDLAATPPPPPAAPTPICRECGTIESVREVVQQGEGSGVGAVAGGVIGGVVGNQVGGGRGKDLATLAGIVGGAVAGHQIEKSQKKTVRYDIAVRLDDGSLRTISAATPPAWRAGDRVRFTSGGLISE